MKTKEVIKMVRVSGVPYEVELEGFDKFKATDYASYDEMIMTLEHENKCMRARMERLEDELRVANELLVKMNIELLNFYNASKSS
jgi:hypothetical protein